MAAPTIVGTTYTQNGNGSNSTTLTLNVPTNSDGNLLIVVYVTDGDSSTASISGSGWTTLEGPQDIPSSLGATSGTFYVWYKTASSDSGSWTITQTVSERALAVAFAVSGHNGIDVENTYLSGSDTSAESNNLTTSVNDCLRISIVGSVGVKTVTTLTGHTLLVTQTYTSAGTISVQYKTIASAGADTGQTATVGSSYWCTYAFAIKPVSGTTYNQTAAGSMTPSGAVVRITTKKVAGTLTPAGTIVRSTIKKVAGVLTPAGALIKTTAKKVAGALTPTGALATQKLTIYLQAIAGTLTPTGALARRTNKALAGTLDLAGGISKRITKVLAGVLGLAGALVRQVFDFDQADVTLSDAAVTVCSLADAAVTAITLSDTDVTIFATFADAAVTTLTLTDSAVTTLTISDATT